MIENNYESLDVKEQMVDTDNYDFRPVAGGGFITPDGGQIIGAYTSGESSLTYWIPGRKLYKSSFPIPRDGGTVPAERMDVICQTGFRAGKCSTVLYLISICVSVLQFAATVEHV